jgi:hypothetical protein
MKHMIKMDIMYQKALYIVAVFNITVSMEKANKKEKSIVLKESIIMVKGRKEYYNGKIIKMNIDMKVNLIIMNNLKVKVKIYLFRNFNLTKRKI